MTFLSADQIALYAYNAGFRGQGLVIAVAISLAESGGNTVASGFNPPDISVPSGSTDRGLWQINNVYHGEVSDQCAFDPQCCAYATYRISSGGTVWRWWSTFENGAYLSNLALAQQAAVYAASQHVVPIPKQTLWHRELTPWAYRSQIRMPVQAGYPPNNRSHDCGPACISMAIEYLSGQYISEDNILDHEYWRSFVGDTSILAMQTYLRDYWHINTYVTLPRNIKDARRTERIAIVAGKPVIELGWLHLDGKRLGHFRCCTGITNSASIMANPASGKREVENKQVHWDSCKRGIIVLNRHR